MTVRERFYKRENLRRCLDPRAFDMQQLLLSLDAPAVTGERAIRPHYTVARNSHGQRISGAGSGNGTRGVRLAELLVVRPLPAIQPVRARAVSVRRR